METTVFSNEQKKYSTLIEGENIKLTGTATFGSGESWFEGQAYKKDDNTYVGDYSKNNVSKVDSEPVSTLSEIITIMAQLETDVNKKAEEVQA